MSGGLSAATSADRLRLRTARAKCLILQAQGRVVAAVSPTLYAGNAGTLGLLVHAGDQVRRGQILARIASPERAARLA